MRRCTAFAALVLAAWAGPAVAAPAAERAYEPRPKGTLTFNKDVAPLLFAHCAECHRPGEVAPFSLLTYRDAKKRAGQIAEATAARLMPPWMPAEGHGEFRGARRLTADRIGLLQQWADEGAIEGEAKDLPPAPAWPGDGWKLGKPDIVATMPKAYRVPAEGPDVYRNFVVPVEIPRDKYIKALEFRPGNRKLVHHAGFCADPTPKSRERDGSDGAPGYTQVSFPGRLLPGSLSFWVPGKESRPLPDGMAAEWPVGADFVVQLHLHPSGKAEEVQAAVGVYLTSEAPRRRFSQLVLQDKAIDIPPGEKAYRTSATKTLEADSELLSVFPHMHLIGRDVSVTATLPDGTEKSLLRIDRWDFNWQNYYEYVEPVSLPKGTRVTMGNRHDNSAENPANPSRPPRRVTAGEQTTNEMSLVLLHLVPKPAPAGAVAAAPAAGAKAFAAQARGAIRKFDADGDGKLSAAEIGKIPGTAAVDVPAAVKRFDKDGDGKLDAEELAAAIAALRGAGK